jgi:hypothetical protein
LVKDFIAKNKVATLEHPQYSPDLPSADFYLFPRLSSALKGRRLCDATDLIKNAAEELKRLTKWLPEMFPTPLLSLAGVYICTRGLFGRKCRVYDCTVLYFSEIM